MARAGSKSVATRSARRAGLGRLLLERVEAGARHAGCRRLVLEASEDAPGAWDFYRYEEKGRETASAS